MALLTRDDVPDEVDRRDARDLAPPCPPMAPYDVVDARVVIVPPPEPAPPAPVAREQVTIEYVPLPARLPITHYTVARPPAQAGHAIKYTRPERGKR